MLIRKIDPKEKQIIKAVVQIHLDTFNGFFLAFMGRGFLTCLYRCYCQHKESGLLVAFENNEPIGFLAYSGNYSGLYKYMIKRKLVQFLWFSIGAFIKKPIIFFRLIKAFLKSNDVKREEKYVELASIGVKPEAKKKGVGSALVTELKKEVNFEQYSYISLETDTDNNNVANMFYLKNGFECVRTYKTREGRKMNEYRYDGKL